MSVKDTINHMEGFFVKEYGMRPADFMRSNKAVCVEARHVLVKVLCEMGYKDTEIADAAGLTRPCVCMIRNGFKKRMRNRCVKAIYMSALMFVCQ